MKIFEVVIDEKNMHSGVNAISIVDSPAIEVDFIALSKEEQEFKLQEIDADKRILMGPVLIPNKPIIRLTEDGEKFYIIFSKETIRRAMELFFIRGRQGETTEDHMVNLVGNTVVESWIKEDAEKDKSAIYGLNVPVGTWLVSMKISNEETYKKAKSGELKGFSIEGFFKPEERAGLSAILKKDEKSELVEKIRNVILDEKKQK